MFPATRERLIPMMSDESETVVRAISLSKRLDDRAILRNLNFEIGSGEFVGLLGANGAGKTTLLKMLATLTAPSEGKLELFGESVARNPQVRARIGLISHQSMLYRDFTPMENMQLFGRLYGLEDVLGRAKEVLAATGIYKRANDPVKNLSRGMVQRVAIARALLHDPDLILADEPFAGLDAGSVKSLEHVLTRLNNDGKTVVLVTHDVEQSLRLSTRTIILRGGKIAVDEAAFRLYPQEVLSEVMAP